MLCFADEVLVLFGYSRPDRRRNDGKREVLS